MHTVPASAPELVSARPRLRGVWHTWAFALSIPLGVVLILVAESGRARAAAAIFAASVTVMFGASALYHRVTWTPARRIWMRRVDHIGIHALIAGTYTPFGVLVLSGAWRVTVLAVVWAGTALVTVLKLLWPSGPKWLAAVIGVSLGWVGVVAFPQLVDGAGLAPPLLALGGGLFYTVGAIVYVLRRPNPWPGVFAYHEVFHTLVVVAVALQYAAVALVVT